MAEEVKKIHIFGIQLSLVVVITFATQNVTSENSKYFITKIARYLLYLLLIKGSRQASIIAYRRLMYNSDISRQLTKAVKENKKFLLVFPIAPSILFYWEQTLLDEDFLWLFIAYLISQYPEIDKKVMINYGTGMACSYFEGYLVQVIPSDGANFVGFQENIAIFESHERVVFPVKRLFIIITESLYCPPNLRQFNKQNRPDLPYLEACRSLEDVVRDVAGVTNRTYRNSAYKIRRPGAPPVHLAAECATPLHTLHKVLEKRALYDKLCDVDAKEIVADFCEQLESTIARSPDCRNKCTLIYYDDTNPDVNLADLLLEKIAEIQPDFEEIIVNTLNIENDLSSDEEQANN